jgi:hypothetical protein
MLNVFMSLQSHLVRRTNLLGASFNTSLAVTLPVFDPTQLLSLNCFVLGDGPNRMFTVKILKTENVSILKKSIKEENSLSLSNVDARNIDLWRVNFPIDDLPSKIPMTLGPTLRSEKLLSDVFPSELDTNRIHVFVGQGEYINSDLLLLINPSRHTLSSLTATTICIQIPNLIYRRGRPRPGDILPSAKVRSSFKWWESSNVSQQTRRGQGVHTM